MVPFDFAIAARIRETALGNQADLIAGLASALDAKDCTPAWGEAVAYDVLKLPAELAGPALVIQWQIAGMFAALILPEQGGLLPPSYANADATTHSKLSTLAQELGLQIFPDEFEQAAFRYAAVPSAASGLAEAKLAANAGLLPLTLTSGTNQCDAALIWPYADGEVFKTPASPAPVTAAQPPAAPQSAPVAKAASAPQTAAKPAASTTTKPAPVAAKADEPPPPVFEGLPNYTRSILKISVPVRVTLAEKRQPISSILDLGPGAIIQFEKSCEEMLDLCVGDQRVARGEAVKVGDKFGIRITSMTMPQERFKTVKSPAKAS